MAVRAPGSVHFSPEEQDRLLRAQVALLLHMPPRQVDAMPLQDVLDVVQLHTAQRILAGRRSPR